MISSPGERFCFKPFGSLSIDLLVFSLILLPSPVITGGISNIKKYADQENVGSNLKDCSILIVSILGFGVMVY